MIFPQGIYMVVASPRISLSTRFLLGVSLASWLTMPVSALNVLLARIYPFSLGAVLDFACGLTGAVPLAMLVYGYVKQHPIHRWE